MRLAIVGHSLASPRQAIFCDAIRALGHEVLEVYPSRWHQESRAGGFEVENEGSMQFFTFGFDAFRQVHEWNPDLIYSMSEFWQAQSKVSAVWAKRLRVPLAYFFWENLRLPTPEQAGLIKGASLVVCGNRAAKDIVCGYNPNAVVIPQVGIDTEIFRPLGSQKDIDMLNVGRQIPEKGIEYIRRAHPQTVFIHGIGFNELPEVYNRAKIFVSFPYDTSTWVEQAGNYVNVEALSCGVPVVTSDAGTIPEWLGGCGGTVILPQKDGEALKKTIEELLPDDERRAYMGEAGRDWVERNMSKEVIAKRLMDAVEAQLGLRG